MENDQNLKAPLEQEIEETESRGLAGMIVTYIVCGCLCAGVLIMIFTQLNRSKLILVFEIFAVAAVLLFVMARYIVYSARKEKQEREYLAKHNEPIR